MKDRHAAASSGRIAGWNAAIPFLVLLIAISYVPYASHQAMEETALAREKARHELLVRHVAQRVEEQGRHLVKALARVAADISSMDDDDPHVFTELEGTWNMLSSFIDVDGVALVRCFGILQVGYGVVSHSDPEVWSRVTGTADLTIRNRTSTVSDVWSTRTLGMHITMAAPLNRPGGVGCAAVATVNLERMIDRLFQVGSADHDVSFTALSADGTVLLHSGIDRRPSTDRSEMQAGRCTSCHEDLMIRHRVRDGQSGSGRHMIAGQDRVVAYAPVSIGDQVWSISASTLVSEVLRPVAQQNIVSIFFTLAVVVLMAGLGLLVRHGQIRSIRLEEELAANQKMLSLAAEKERLDHELEVSRRMAAVGEMVARVAHEVKNPLQYMGTAVDLLDNRVEEKQARALVADIRTGVRNMDAIVKELLDFSRPMNLEQVSVDVNEVVRETAAQVIPEDVNLKLVLAPALAPVVADGYKLRQVLENLLRNAMESRLDRQEGEDSFLIRVETGRVPGDQGDWVRIRVEDTGIGITGEDLERIWEPFYTSKTRGSGLGLPVVKRIVEAHGGRMEAESRPGSGTRMDVLLPYG